MPTAFQTPSWQNLINTSVSNLSQLGVPQKVNVAQNTATNVPLWLQPNYGELKQTYNNIGPATDAALQPTRDAFNQTLQYNTSMGTQAANSAAREYANRQQQAGGTGAGAGVVRAQSLLPVFQQNASARAQQADTEAEYKFKALDLQANVAQSLAQLRTSYAGTLANYLTQQRGQNIQQAQGNQDASLRAQLAMLQTGQALSNNPRAQDYQGSGILRNGQYFAANNSGYTNATTAY